jgi:putative integral membrane protein (TIGR02587 family)
MSNVKETAPGVQEGALVPYARGIAGGLVFGLPLLFTQEIWYLGFVLEPWRLAALLALQFAALLSYVYFSGFREDRSTGDIAREAIEALGLAVAVAAVTLFAIGQISSDTGLEEIGFKILLASLPVSIGVAVASSQLGSAESQGERRKQRKTGPGSPWEYVLAFDGALLFAYTFASTEEITIIGTSIDWWQALLLLGGSLLVTYGLVFRSNFRGANPSSGEVLQTPFGETVTAYVLALLVAWLILYLVGRITLEDSAMTMLYQTLVLGLPASIGGALGRILV